MSEKITQTRSLSLSNQWATAVSRFHREETLTARDSGEITFECPNITTIEQNLGRLLKVGKRN